MADEDSEVPEWLQRYPPADLTPGEFEEWVAEVFASAPPRLLLRVSPPPQEDEWLGLGRRGRDDRSGHAPGPSGRGFRFSNAILGRRSEDDVEARIEARRRVAVGLGAGHRRGVAGRHMGSTATGGSDFALASTRPIPIDKKKRPPRMRKPLQNGLK